MTTFPTTTSYYIKDSVSEIVIWSLLVNEYGFLNLDTTGADDHCGIDWDYPIDEIASLPSGFFDYVTLTAQGKSTKTQGSIVIKVYKP